ncbi:pyridoxal phosphate biosynthesis protein PdxJ, partial [Vibrio parahaemolyticus AQ3810]
HILDRDVRILRETIQTRMNLEMAVTEEMVEIALKTKPEFVCLVPEKREELTTEGGLDVVGQLDKVKAATQKLTEAGIKVSLFIDADRQQIEAAKQCGAPFIELHTGHYADAETEEEQQAELKKIAAGASYADDLGIIVNAGHGLTYHNVAPIAALPEIYELNIGHSIIGRAVFDGLEKSVAEMKALMIAARK